MKLFELLKVLSSESKAKIIMHFLNCGCTSAPTTSLCKGFELKQANYSKHLMDLKELRILDYVKSSKEIHYKINSEFANEYGELVKEIFKKTCPSSSKMCSNENCIHKG